MPAIPDPSADPPDSPGEEILEGALVTAEAPGQGLVDELAHRTEEVVVLWGTLRAALLLLSQWLMHDVGCAAPPRGASLELVRGWVRAERAVAAGTSQG